MTLSFFMPMLPPKTTAQTHGVTCRGGKPVFFDPPELKAARAKIRAHLARHIPDVPMTPPLRLVTKWCWPCEGTDHVDGEWYVEKPDTHNAVKMPVDEMARLGFFEDDKGIASEVIEKFWATVPGIYVSIEELTK